MTCYETRERRWRFTFYRMMRLTGDLRVSRAVADAAVDAITLICSRIGKGWPL